MQRKAIGACCLVVLLLAAVACAPVPSATSVSFPSATSAEGTVPEPTALPVAEAVEPTAVAEDVAAMPSPTSDAPMAARVNGEPIYLDEYQHALDQYEMDLIAQGIDPNGEEGQALMEQARSWILNVMIEQKLTEQAATEAGVTVSEEQVDVYMQQMAEENGGQEALKAKLAGWGETLESAREEVRAGLIGMAMMERVSQSVPLKAEQVRARHILVDTAPEAESILAQLQASADFATLAQTHSQDMSTRESGGDLGFFPRGVLVAPKVEQVAFALQPGQFSGVFSSTLGYHIVLVVEREPDRPISAENLRILQDQVVQRWIEDLWAEAHIERYVETS